MIGGPRLCRRAFNSAARPGGSPWHALDSSTPRGARSHADVDDVPAASRAPHDHRVVVVRILLVVTSADGADDSAGPPYWPAWSSALSSPQLLVLGRAMTWPVWPSRMNMTPLMPEISRALTTPSGVRTGVDAVT